MLWKYDWLLPWFDPVHSRLSPPPPHSRRSERPACQPGQCSPQTRNCRILVIRAHHNFQSRSGALQVLLSDGKDLGPLKYHKTDLSTGYWVPVFCTRGPRFTLRLWIVVSGVEHSHWSRLSRYSALIGRTLLCWCQGLCHNNTHQGMHQGGFGCDELVLYGIRELA